MNTAWRLVAAIFAGMCFFCFPVAAATADPVSKFEALLEKFEKNTNNDVVFYHNTDKDAWLKRRFDVSDVKYDVKKTDSMVNPILGLVSFDLVISHTSFQPTKAEAEAIQIVPDEKSDRHKISITYAYKNNKWILLKGTYTMGGQVYQFTEEGMRKESTVAIFSALMNWVPK